MEMVTVRFRLQDTTLRTIHKPPWTFYNGTTMRYFADHPVMWWPEGSQSGIPMDGSDLGSGITLRFYTEENLPWETQMVEMRLSSVELRCELRTPFTVVNTE